LPKTNGFRLIQDAGQTSTLVAGKDGRIYMVDNSAEYDISAPWGGLQVDKNIFSYDVFGRLIWFDAAVLIPREDRFRKRDFEKGKPNYLKYLFTWYRMVELGVSAAEHMPSRAQAA
jgi:hypothetical protein